MSKLIKQFADLEYAESMKAIRVIDSRVPQDLSDALKGVLMAANATKFGADTPQGHLVRIGKLVAELLEKLAIATDKKVMIETSRAIAEAIKDVHKYSLEIADSCGNPRLKDNILNASGVPKNFGTQLKVN